MTEQAAPGTTTSSGSDSTDEPLCTQARALAAAPGDDPDEHHEDLVALLRRAHASGEYSAPGLLADAHLDHGERREAVEVLTPAVHGRRRSDLAGLLGETLEALGDHEGAEAAFLVGIDGGHPDAMNDYGVFLRARGRTQEAAYVLDRAARLGDDLAPLNLVALHLEELDDPFTATELAEAYRDDAKPSTLVALADCRLAEDRVDEAEELYRQAAAGGGACAHIYYGWFLRDRRADPDGAEEQLRRAREVKEPGAAFHLARFLYDQGRTDEAHPFFEEASRRGDPDALAVLEAEYRGLVDEWDD